MRILLLTALLFTGAAAQGSPACANTCLSDVATLANCAGPTDAACLCTQVVLESAGQCLAQTCSAADLTAAEQAVVSFCENGVGSPGSAAPSGSQSASGGNSASTSAPFTTGPGPVSSPSPPVSNSATTASSAPTSPAPSETSNAASRASVYSSTLAVIVAALGVSLVL